MTDEHSDRTRIEILIERGTNGFATLSGWLLIGLSVLVTFEIVSRKFFGFSVQGADEIGGYVLVIFSSVGFSYALVKKAHIRVDFVHRRLSPSLQAGFNILAFSLLTGFSAMLAWRAGAVAWESFAIGATAPTPLQTPLAWPQALWALALALFTVISAFYVFRMARLCTTGRVDVAARRFGPSSIEEEVAQELAGAERRSATAAENGTRDDG